MSGIGVGHRLYAGRVIIRDAVVRPGDIIFRAKGLRLDHNGLADAYR